MGRKLAWRIAIGLAAVVLATLTWVYVTQVRPLGLYYGKNRAIARTIENLEHSIPAGVNPHQWRELTTLTGIAFGNVCFSPSHASYAEMCRFEADLDAKLREDTPPDIETLRWIWMRLGQTGPHGKQYVERMIQLFDERLEPPAVPAVSGEAQGETGKRL